MNVCYLFAQKGAEENGCHCGDSGYSFFPAPKPFNRPTRPGSAQRTLASRNVAQDRAEGYTAAIYNTSTAVSSFAHSFVDLRKLRAAAFAVSARCGRDILDLTANHCTQFTSLPKLEQADWLFRHAHRLESSLTLLLRELCCQKCGLVVL